MSNIMIDLETLATDSNAHILSIGAVRFDTTGPVGGTFYRVIAHDSDQRGAVIDPQTVAWWMQQGPLAAAVFADKHATPFAYALRDLEVWMLTPEVQVEPIFVWANSPAFDAVILGNAYKRAGLIRPWKFWNERDYRTLKDLHPDIDAGPFNGTKHNALHDAIHQAQHCAKILAHIS